MRRTLLLLVALLGLLGLAGLGLRGLLSPSPGAALAPAPMVDPTLRLAPAAPDPAPLAPAVKAGAPPGERPPGGVRLGRPAAVASATGDWAAIRPTTLRSWPTLSAALEEARPRLAPCFDEERQAREGPGRYTAIGAPTPGAGAATLVIQLEASAAGRVRIVDAPVESRGAAEDGLLSCVQGALRGLEVRGPGKPGARFRVRYAIRPLVARVADQQILAPRVRMKAR